MRKTSDKGIHTRERILDYMRSYYASNGVPPTFGEIQDHLGYASKSTVAHYMKSLADDGKVRKINRGSRSIYLPI